MVAAQGSQEIDSGPVRVSFFLVAGDIQTAETDFVAIDLVLHLQFRGQSGVGFLGAVAVLELLGNSHRRPGDSRRHCRLFPNDTCASPWLDVMSKRNEKGK